jgi:hypothetical protein
MGGGDHGPALLTACADEVTNALQGYLDVDWSVLAGDLEWDVEETVAHMIGSDRQAQLVRGVVGAVVARPTGCGRAVSSCCL